MGRKSKDKQISQSPVIPNNNLTLPLLRAPDNTPYVWGVCETTGKEISIVFPNVRNGLETLTGTPADMFPAICHGDIYHRLKANCRVALIRDDNGEVEATVVKHSCQLENQCPIKDNSNGNGKKGKRK